MCINMQQIILRLLQKHGFYLGMLSCIYILGWFLKSLYGYNFDLSEYRQFLIVISGYLLGVYGVNSGLNTKFQSNKPKE